MKNTTKPGKAQTGNRKARANNAIVKNSVSRNAKFQTSSKVKPASESKTQKPETRKEKRQQRERGRLDLDYGSRLGSIVGEGAQTLMEVLGFGEYEVKKNSLLNCIDTGTSPPSVRNKHKGEGTVISHREYVGDLYTNTTTGAFQVNRFEINIGNPALFPLGAGIAQNFQEWEVEGMLVELKSQASDYAPGVSLGTMFCAVDYNSLDVSPASKVELENMEYAMSCKVSESLIMPVECARQNDVMTHLYVDNRPDALDGDKRLYNLGSLYIGTQGVAASAVTVAEIWVTYQVCLYKPILQSPPVNPSQIRGFAATAADFYKNHTVSDPLGIFDSSMSDSVWVDPNRITFNQSVKGRRFMMLWQTTSTATFTGTATAPTIVLNGCVNVSNYFATAADFTSSFFVSNLGAVVTNSYSFGRVFDFPYTITSVIPFVTVSWPSYPVGSNGCFTVSFLELGVINPFSIPTLSHPDNDIEMIRQRVAIDTARREVDHDFFSVPHTYDWQGRLLDDDSSEEEVVVRRKTSSYTTLH